MNATMSIFSDFKISLSISKLNLKLSIRWISLIIMTRTRRFSEFVSERNINNMTYLFVVCLCASKFCTVINVIMIRIEMFFALSAKKFAFVNVIFAFVSQHVDENFSFSVKLISFVTYCYSLKSYFVSIFLLESTFDLMIKLSLSSLIVTTKTLFESDMIESCSFESRMFELAWRTFELHTLERTYLWNRLFDKKKRLQYLQRNSVITMLIDI